LREKVSKIDECIDIEKQGLPLPVEHIEFVIPTTCMYYRLLPSFLSPYPQVKERDPITSNPERVNW